MSGKFPNAWSSLRDNVYVAMNCGSAVTLASASAGDDTRSTHVQRNRHPCHARILGHPCRIRQQPNAQILSRNRSRCGWSWRRTVSVGVLHDSRSVIYGLLHGETRLRYLASDSRKPFNTEEGRIGGTNEFSSRC